MRVTIAAPNLRLSRSVITAMWASPIATQDLLAGRRRSTRAVGSSSSIRWSAGPILSRSALDCGSIATERVGSGKSIGGRTSGFSRVGQRVAGLGDGELGDGADLAGPQLADRLLLLAVEEQQLADPLVLAAVGVPGVALAVERPREHPEVGQPPDERVGRGLEHPGERAGRRVGRDRDGVAGLRVRRRRRAGSSAGDGR